MNDWICRTWVETPYGWHSDFDRFATEEEAVEHGEIAVKYVGADVISADYEVYRDSEN